MEQDSAWKDAGRANEVFDRCVASFESPFDRSMRLPLMTAPEENKHSVLIGKKERKEILSQIITRYLPSVSNAGRSFRSDFRRIASCKLKVTGNDFFCIRIISGETDQIE